MISNETDSLLSEFVKRKKLADYITFSRSGHNAVRETTDMLMGLSGIYDETITNRIEFSSNYRQYLSLRNKSETNFYTNKESVITEQTPV
jgi:3-deoxy-D-manno-octulosonate 8-phosphate phosphatase (KDO 8-P phosphatase)